jgi:hypothetical protein
MTWVEQKSGTPHWRSPTATKTCSALSVQSRAKRVGGTSADTEEHRFANLGLSLTCTTCLLKSTFVPTGRCGSSPEPARRSQRSQRQFAYPGRAEFVTRRPGDPTARAAVTGAGRAFGRWRFRLSGGTGPRRLRAKTIRDGREIVLGMARCRIPVVAPSWPGCGPSCSLVALSAITIYIAKDAFLADPHGR